MIAHNSDQLTHGDRDRLAELPTAEAAMPALEVASFAEVQALTGGTHDGPA